jgi:hypothetical protein
MANIKNEPGNMTVDPSKGHWLHQHASDYSVSMWSYIQMATTQGENFLCCGLSGLKSD